MTARDNYFKYRNQIKSSTPPCIPLLTVYLNDLTSIETEMRSFTIIDNRNIINVEKISRIGDVISDLLLYRQQYHQYQRVNQIFDFFDRGLFYMDDEQVSTKSRELEPTLPEGEIQKEKEGGVKTPAILRKVSKVFSKKLSTKKNIVTNNINTN